MRPTQACPWCGSTRFGIVKDLYVEIVSDEKVGHGNVIHPRFSVVVCGQCGVTHFFASREAHVLSLLKHDVVDVADRGRRA
jgi:predicted nucleic-acid-binding Zn-ribbon protein